ncbi:SDR family NAD(P)-dependent oxidoreductase [Paenibacillus sp. NPDC058367]|uniref:type I polyketide synthase n=1 Tax=Paenibacillus sp. NPDC058367 TaxID=3346460 RepID=UPI00364A3DCE
MANNDFKFESGRRKRDTEASRPGTNRTDQGSRRDIAVIGLSCQFGSSKNRYEYWDALSTGKDQIGPYPQERRADAENYLRHFMNADDAKKLNFSEKAYLEEIDKFDYQLFAISPTEASLMDPNQRLFLEAVWGAIEDAGYGGKKLVGSKTGIYVGYCNISLEEYLRFIEMADPSLFNISIPGNIKSIIASRINYLFDLKGPSMLIDTACSSSLTAVHIACQAIRNGDCDLAVAGGVKLNLIPGVKSENEDIGISASDGRTRTFDDSSDGTGGGEGVGAILLKPLHQAMLDGDDIYAVIKGSAINQDGSSVGITAPNSAAQEAVILKAWEDARVNPNTITYIEAHGTGTKLGDPVEMNGLERAFRKHTDKKQFCAIGSVKTNIGHLDGAAGMAGMIKAILSLHYKKLPPSLHFKRPNRSIPFIDSPLYINDRLMEWEYEKGPRRCGVSSFGLSGTNSHVILEEAPPVIHKSCASGERLLTLSAKSKEALKALVGHYGEHLLAEPEVALESLCYTANTGRGHYNYRLALLLSDKEELRDLLQILLNQDPENVNSPRIYYGESKLISQLKESREQGEITKEDKHRLTCEAEEWIIRLKQHADTASLAALAKVYTRGAEVEWEHLYEGQEIHKTRAPLYPFTRKRCWIESKGHHERRPASEKTIGHPLLDRCLAKSIDTQIYSTIFSIERHWELREHVLGGHSILPGTSYIEMAREVGSQYYGSQNIELRNVLFTLPLVVDQDEEKEVQTSIRMFADHLEFTIVSKARPESEWVKHAEGFIYPLASVKPKMLDISEIQQRSLHQLIIDDEALAGALVHTGPRWRNIRKLYIGDDEVLAKLEISEAYVDEMKKYYLYPSLLDGAVNAANGTAGEGLYLPLHYEKARFAKAIPGRFYSYLRRKSMSKASDEVAAFDISLVDLDGEVFGEIENYTIKKLHEFETKLQEISGKQSKYHEICWIPKPRDAQLTETQTQPKRMIMLANESSICQKMSRYLESSGVEVTQVLLGTVFQQIDGRTFILPNTLEGFAQLLQATKHLSADKIIHAWGLSEDESPANVEQVNEQIQLGVISLFHLSKALAGTKRGREMELIVMATEAFEVNGEEQKIHPHHASLFGLAKVISHENTKIPVRCVELDGDESVSAASAEILMPKQEFTSSYRNGVRYVEQFTELQLQRELENGLKIRPGGVYVITGGTGGIGLEIGKYLASFGDITIILLSRTTYPAKGHQPELAKQKLQAGYHRLLDAVREMESCGATVEWMSVDITEEHQLEPALEHIRAKYGTLSGMIHCAGVAGEGYIIRKEVEEMVRVLKPKVQGTWLLDKLTEKDPLDFFILCSSLTSVFGAPGQSDYTAANAYQDAYSFFRNKQGRKTLTINWAGWNETGMALDYGVSEKAGMFKPLTSAEGILALTTIGSLEHRQVLVGEVNDSIFAESIPFLPVSLSPALNAKYKRSHTSINNLEQVNNLDAAITIKGKDREALTPTELRIAGIWAKVLGMSEIDIYDKFFEIGGDSLLASHLLKEVEKVYPGVIDITDVFIYSTILEMAGFIESKTVPAVIEGVNVNSSFEDNIDFILERLASGKLAADQAEAYIQD